MSSPFHLNETEWNQLVATRAVAAQPRTVEDIVQELIDEQPDDRRFLDPDHAMVGYYEDHEFDLGVCD